MAFGTLMDRTGESTGIIVLRGVTTSTSIYPPDYVEVPIVIDELEQINAQLELKNWTAIWDSGLCPQDPAVPWPGGEE